MLNKLKAWLFLTLLVNLKTKIVDGTVNLLKVISVDELFAFTKLFARRQSFVREIRTVNVKKGKRKYTLLFITTLDGTTRINLGRHKTFENFGEYAAMPLSGSNNQQYHINPVHYAAA